MIYGLDEDDFFKEKVLFTSLKYIKVHGSSYDSKNSPFQLSLFQHIVRSSVFSQPVVVGDFFKQYGGINKLSNSATQSYHSIIYNYIIGNLNAPRHNPLYVMSLSTTVSYVNIHQTIYLCFYRFSVTNSMLYFSQLKYM
jgi:hypothetical protein